MELAGLRRQRCRPDLGRYVPLPVRAPEKLPYAIELFKSELHRCYRALESQLSKTEYLVDSEFTIADISVFPFITIASQTAPTLFEKYPSLKRWHDW